MSLREELQAAINADLENPEKTISLAESVALVILKHGEKSIKDYFKGLLYSAEGKADKVEDAVDNVATVVAAPFDAVPPVEVFTPFVPTPVVDVLPVVDAAPVVEAAPIEAAPIEAAPIEAAPIEAAPIEAAPIEAAPLVDAVPYMATPFAPVPVVPPAGV